MAGEKRSKVITHNYLINMNAVDDQTRLRLKPVRNRIAYPSRGRDMRQSPSMM